LFEIIPMEAMGSVFDPSQQAVIGNSQHPEYPEALAN
jgi:hypothetical protein